MSLEMISAQDAQSLLQQNPQVKILDVRTAFEFGQKYIDPSLNIPIDMLSAKISELSKSAQSYILVCQSGNRAAMAADMLMQSGINDVKVMQGGIANWQKQKLPIVKGQAGMSLERQVRVIAGSLILSGIILSWLVHWSFIFIPTFVSCGLIFAGLTDSCLMGVLLMKLPYNKKLYKPKAGVGTCSI